LKSSSFTPDNSTCRFKFNGFRGLRLLQGFLIAGDGGCFSAVKIPLATGKSHGILEIKKGGDDSRTLSHILIEV
jgi:hypothetical protein